LIFKSAKPKKDFWIARQKTKTLLQPRPQRAIQKSFPCDLRHVRIPKSMQIQQIAQALPIAPASGSAPAMGARAAKPHRLLNVTDNRHLQTLLHRRAACYKTREEERKERSP